MYREREIIYNNMSSRNISPMSYHGASESDRSMWKSTGVTERY